MPSIFDLTLILVFSIGTLVMIKQYLKNGFYLFMFIGINSMNAAFGIVKLYISNKHFILYNNLRIIICLTIILAVYVIRKTHETH